MFLYLVPRLYYIIGRCIYGDEFSKVVQKITWLSMNDIRNRQKEYVKFYALPRNNVFCGSLFIVNFKKYKFIFICRNNPGAYKKFFYFLLTCRRKMHILYLNNRSNDKMFKRLVKL